MRNESSWTASNGFIAALLAVASALVLTGCIPPPPPAVPHGHLPVIYEREPVVIVHRPTPQTTPVSRKLPSVTSRYSSRIADAGPVRFTIEKVERQGNNLLVSGTIKSQKDVLVEMFRNRCGATSPGGDSGLRCELARLGDCPNTANARISVVAGDPYSFSVTIATHGSDASELTELRLGVRVASVSQMLSFTHVAVD